MKYILVQGEDKCLNIYKVTMFYVKELSVYAKLAGKKIILGTFNTKEDAKNEFYNIISNLSNNNIFAYQVNKEDYWVKKRIENELKDIFQTDKDEVEKDSDLVDIINSDNIDNDEDQDILYVKENEENLIEEEENDDLDDFDVPDSVDNE